MIKEHFRVAEHRLDGSPRIPVRLADRCHWFQETISYTLP